MTLVTIAINRSGARWQIGQVRITIGSRLVHQFTNSKRYGTWKDAADAMRRQASAWLALRCRATASKDIAWHIMPKV
jgi:hypothetical protein